MQLKNAHRCHAIELHCVSFRFRIYRMALPDGLSPWLAAARVHVTTENCQFAAPNCYELPVAATCVPRFIP